MKLISNIQIYLNEGLNNRIQGHFGRLICFKWLVGSSVDSKVYDLDGSSARHDSKVSLKWLVGSSVDFKVYFSDGPSGRQLILTSYQQVMFLAHQKSQ